MTVELHHRFTVPAGIEETWATFTDIEGVAGCFPGATVTEADSESFKGTVKVKLGPIALVYNGSGHFVEKDEAGHRLVIDARGKDKRGNGTAGAMVTATLSEGASGSTDVEVRTDLSITGKAAQFGRGGVIQDVSDKLLGQFVACLEERLAGGPADADAATAAPAAAPAGVPDPAEPGASGAAAPSADGAAPGPVPDPEAPWPGEQPAGSAAPAPPTRGGREPDDGALDLGVTVLPVLARAYWKPAAAVLIVLALLLGWRRARG